MELTVRDTVGNKRRYFRNRSLDSQGPPCYNRLAADNGHTLTAEEQTTLLAQLAKPRVQRNPGCQTALDNFIGRTAK